ncbi:MAG: hypothetical protein K2H61_01640, partial [Muribaculaceae bacterium]|nr:hypothetical protein [Muribaculaceae bacterium]
ILATAQLNEWTNSLPGFTSTGFSTNPKKAVCHNWPSVSLLSEFGLSHILMYAPIVLILSA